MKHACIFDFDGVVIESERYWEDVAVKRRIYTEVYGIEIAEKLHNKTLGLNMDAIHKRATSYGSTATIQSFYNACDTQARIIYANAPLTNGLDVLLDELRIMNISLGIVSASPKLWIDIALKRLQQSSMFKTIISLHERSDLKHKPDPDGYLEAMKNLGVKPFETVIIEDSNTGIRSAKASGAFTIGLKQNLVPGYAIDGADVYIDTINEAVKYMKEEYAES